MIKVLMSIVVHLYNTGITLIINTKYRFLFIMELKMEVEEKTIDLNESEPAYFELAEEKRLLLEKRGFFPMEKGTIDDTYYTNKAKILMYTHLTKENISVQQLLNMSFSQMEQLLFMKDSMIAMPVVFYFERESWYYSFNSDKIYYDVDPLCLEPYIAKYVRAINRCGIETFYSCDGWHAKPNKSKEIVILFRDRYSWLWHSQLCRIYGIEKDCPWEFEKVGSDYVARIALPKGDEGKKHIYDRVILSANIFIRNNILLKSIKKKFIMSVNGYEMDALSNQEVEERFCEYISNCI